jgi:hypothetical protein
VKFPACHGRRKLPAKSLFAHAAIGAAFGTFGPGQAMEEPEFYLPLRLSCESRVLNRGQPESSLHRVRPRLALCPRQGLCHFPPSREVPASLPHTRLWSQRRVSSSSAGTCDWIIEY